MYLANQSAGRGFKHGHRLYGRKINVCVSFLTILYLILFVDLYKKRLLRETESLIVPVNYTVLSCHRYIIIVVKDS